MITTAYKARHAADPDFARGVAAAAASVGYEPRHAGPVDDGPVHKTSAAAKSVPAGIRVLPLVGEQSPGVAW